MEKLISLFVIVSFVCHLVATSETTGRTIEYRNRTLVSYPTFFEDNFMYVFCNVKLDDNEVPKCRVTRIRNIFEKNTVTKNCDFEFKTTNETSYPWNADFLGADHAMMVAELSLDIIIVRFEDCKYVKSSLEDSQATDLNEKFKALGIYPDEILKGGYGVYHKRNMLTEESFDRKGNVYWNGLYGRTSYASEARNLLSQNTSSKYRFYNKHAEFKQISWKPTYSWSSLLVGSAAHDYLSIYKYHNNRVSIEQFDQDGKMKVSYPTDSKEDPYATYNIPEGGFYFLSPVNNTNTVRLTKVNVKSEGTHVLDVDDVKFEKLFLKREFKFYEKEDKELCLSWVHYDLDKTTGTINWFTRCFEEVQILENFWEKTLDL